MRKPNQQLLLTISDLNRDVFEKLRSAHVEYIANTKKVITLQVFLFDTLRAALETQ